jgi:outer membrane biosynthesis protein TonB
LAFEKHRQDNAYIHIRINRKVSVAIVVSLLVHALLLWVLSSLDLLNPKQQPESPNQTMVVQLNPPGPKKTEAAPPPLVPQPPPIAPLRKTRKPTTPPRMPERNDSPKVIAVPTEVPTAVPQITTPTKPEAPPARTPMLDPSKFPDMASYLAAVREQKRATGTDAGLINEEERERADQATRPPKKDAGGNGIFQILSMDARAGRFAFRGWKNEFSYSHREVYEVYASPDANVQRAMIRKMIEIIRRDYSGDFNWESPRFGRVIVLSARLKDNDGLEDFLIKEFFGEGGPSSQ